MHVRKKHIYTLLSFNKGPGELKQINPLSDW